MNRRLLLSVGISAVLAVSLAAQRPVFPGAEWERAAPASAGYCADKLEKVTELAKSATTSAMMVVAGGRSIYEYGDVTTVSYLASVRKSILAMLFGKYVANGTIRLNKTLAEIGIDDHGGLTDAEKQATVEHLLMAKSGVYHEASNSGDDLASAPPRGSQKPGTYFLYSNWDFNALGTIFEKETGKGIYDALETDLAMPIGMRDFDKASHRRTGNANASQHLAYHMNFSTRDMARLGYLVLREGNWNGKQIIPRDWARKMVQPHTRLQNMNPRGRVDVMGYGYLWWVWDGPEAKGAYEGAYTGRGAVGQYITVLPRLDMVIAHKTVPGGGRSVGWPAYRQIIQAVVDARCRPGL
jgi:CubicO group peptidase (beta-lactamase class C family)